MPATEKRFGPHRIKTAARPSPNQRRPYANPHAAALPQSQHFPFFLLLLLPPPSSASKVAIVAGSRTPSLQLKFDPAPKSIAAPTKLLPHSPAPLLLLLVGKIFLLSLIAAGKEKNEKSVIHMHEHQTQKTQKRGMHDLSGNFRP